MEKKILIIANPFPPTQGGNVQRISHFIKYLPRFGWSPIVVAPEIKGSKRYDKECGYPVFRVKNFGPQILYKAGLTLLRRDDAHKNEKPIIDVKFKNRKRVLSFLNFFFQPDEFFIWAFLAAIKGISVCKENNIKAVLSTSPYNSNHIAALIVHRSTSLPWIADFRDPWTMNPFVVYNTKFHRNLNLFLENKVVTSAEKIITISNPMLKDFCKRYSQQADKFQLISNGFDKEEFEKIRPFTPLESKDRIVITHTGSFYAGRTPLAFLEAIKKIKDKTTINSPIEINFAGYPPRDFIPYINENNLKDIVNIVGFVPHDKAIELQLRSDILLLVPGLGEGTMTGKVFEYLATGKPIFALTPSKSALSELLKETGVGIIAPPDDPVKIANLLLDLVEQIQKGVLPEPNWEIIYKYDRRILTKQLADILDEVTYDIG